MELHIGSSNPAKIRQLAAAVAPVGVMVAALDRPPGVNVRRIPGAAGRPTDDEVLRYYTDQCAGRAGRLRAHWMFGFAIAVPDGPCFVDETTVQRMFMTPPSTHRRAGYPLDSLQQDPATGRYLAEFTGEAEQELWRRTIGAPLQAFVARIVGRLRTRRGVMTLDFGGQYLRG